LLRLGHLLHALPVREGLAVRAEAAALIAQAPLLMLATGGVAADRVARERQRIRRVHAAVAAATRVLRQRDRRNRGRRDLVRERRGRAALVDARARANRERHARQRAGHTFDGARPIKKRLQRPRERLIRSPTDRDTVRA